MFTHAVAYFDDWIIRQKCYVTSSSNWRKRGLPLKSTISTTIKSILEHTYTVKMLKDDIFNYKVGISQSIHSFLVLVNPGPLGRNCYN